MKLFMSLTSLLVCLLSTSVALAGNSRGPRIMEEKFNPPRTAKVGEPYSYVVPAEDPENGELTYDLTFGPQAMRIDPKTGKIDWTPTPDDGSCMITIRVVDAFGHSATRSWGIVVSP